jgi:hypothetical protein
VWPEREVHGVTRGSRSSRVRKVGAGGDAADRTEVNKLSAGEIWFTGLSYAVYSYHHIETH